jgi:hypothetical protein
LRINWFTVGIESHLVFVALRATLCVFLALRAA